MLRIRYKKRYPVGKERKISYEPTILLYPFWSTPADDVLQQLQTMQKGLTVAEAELHARRATPHRRNTGKKPRAFVQLLSQFTDPISVILLFSAGISLRWFYSRVMSEA